ncbi:MAG: WD40 repeat domain-containing protein, partial [Chloroflexota bacterium]
MLRSRRGRRLLAAWGVMIGIAIFFGGDVRREIASTDHGDMLAYVTQDYRLMLYDPRTRTETELMTGVRDFRLSRDGRVAFKNTDENDHDVYVYDPATPDVAPINISQDAPVKNTPLSWSPDGRYLAYIKYLELHGNQLLYVWDGEKTIKVMPDQSLNSPRVYQPNWSEDGRLAFSVTHGWSDGGIYIWDGTRTLKLADGSEGAVGGSEWSSDGKLMFFSNRENVGDVYIWDGASFRDGLPDVSTFVPVAPH